MWPVALLVFFASITVPVLKLIGLTFLLITTQRRSRWRLRDRSLMYRIIEQVGRWSMVDIFMISILVALVNLGTLATIEPGAGAICFAAVVIITMFASMSFDPRLIWDAEESGHAQATPSALERGELPEVEVKKRRGISLVWLIPLVAGAIAIWLAYTTLQEKGSRITVDVRQCRRSRGREDPGQVPQRRGRPGRRGRLERGSVAHVVIASLDKAMEPHMTEGTRFWIVRPRVGFGGVSGLGTLLSGAYVELDPVKASRAGARRIGGAAANHLRGARDPVRPAHR